MRGFSVLQITALAVMLVFSPTNSVASAQRRPVPAPVQRPQRLGSVPGEIVWDSWGVPHIFATTAACGSRTAASAMNCW
jgi:acyl-homoserine lactone acylase PvdQ